MVSPLVGEAVIVWAERANLPFVSRISAIDRPTGGGFRAIYRRWRAVLAFAEGRPRASPDLGSKTTGEAAHEP
ncbi:MAG: hypothetical protein ACHP7A_09315, partial [Caulobacterales bacterium]